jgi:hypothetical protein
MAIECHNPYIKNKVYWIVFPTKAQAKEAIWKDPSMLFRAFPREMIDRQNEVEMTLYLKSGSILILKGADDPESLRGAGPYGIGFDEFDDMKPEAWGITEPIIRANGGWAWFLGTPKGKSNLWNLHQRSLSGDPEWSSYLLKASTSKVIAEHELQALRRSLNQALYNQELECEFLEGEASVFRGVREIMTATPEEPQDGHHYVIGCDLAKVRDYTVMAVYDRQTNKQVYQSRFNTIEWPYQKQKIRAIAEHYNHALVIIDATGVGDPVADDLLRSGVAVEPFKFTQESKKDIVEKLSIWIEQKKIEMLPIDETAFEFDNFAYEMLPGGKLRYSAPDGYNDDIVTAHALAVSSLQPVYKASVLQPSPVRQEYARAVRSLQRDDNEYQGI